MLTYETNYTNDPSKSRGKAKESHQNLRDNIDQNQEQFTIQELKTENTKLKKMLKEAQSKRSQITKQCSQLNKHLEKIENENNQLKHRVKQQQQKFDGGKYRWEELKFLNKQLSSEIEQLRTENQSITQKLRYSSQILERKYQQLEEKTYKRMQQSVKRVKKTIHYLQNLSTKQLDKTRDILIENLRRSIELLRGKSYEQFNCEGEIQQLMSPLKTMQQQIILKTKQANNYKQENIRLLEEISKYKSIEKDQIPMFKEAIDKLKKNLVQVRSQLSENQYEKIEIKKKYEQRLKQSDYKFNQLFKQCRKIKLQKKIYQNKLEELEADVEQQKQRLMGQNLMLKKLYNNDSSSSRISQTSGYYGNSNQYSKDKKTLQKKVLKKNYSSNQLKTSNAHMKNSVSEYEIGARVNELSSYNEQSSMLSQQNLKDEICRIDEQIMEIQKNLTKQLEAYR